MKFAPSSAFRVYDEFDNYRQNEDGSFIVEVTYPKGEWIFGYIESFGEECEILEPEDIRKDIKIRLMNTLKHYL